MRYILVVAFVHQQAQSVVVVAVVDINVTYGKLNVADGGTDMHQTRWDPLNCGCGVSANCRTARAFIST